MKKHLCALFDLDGVIVDTAKYHFLAWKSIASKIGYDLTNKDNEQLKGIGRADSLRQICKWAGVTLDPAKFNQFLIEKNEVYLSFIQNLGPSEMLPGIYDGLLLLTKKGVKIGLGSASKNANYILEKLELSPFFQVIIDGNQVEKGKPNPEVFLKGAAALNVAPNACVVFEDSAAGILAAKAAEMTAVALGQPNAFTGFDYCYPDFLPLSKKGIQQLF